MTRIFILFIFSLTPCIQFSNADEPEPTSAKKLLERSKEISRLRQQIEDSKKHYHQGPRHKFITSPSLTHLSPVYREYIEAWVKKMEHIGTSNYPAAALKINDSANVLVDVAINSDGSVQKIKILKSSGYPELDKSVLSLVNLAAPFSLFPEEIKRETDVLHITRKWHFIPKSQTDNNTHSKN